MARSKRFHGLRRRTPDAEASRGRTNSGGSTNEFAAGRGQEARCQATGLDIIAPIARVPADSIRTERYDPTRRSAPHSPSRQPHHDPSHRPQRGLATHHSSGDQQLDAAGARDAGPDLAGGRVRGSAEPAGVGQRRDRGGSVRGSGGGPSRLAVRHDPGRPRSPRGARSPSSSGTSGCPPGSFQRRGGPDCGDRRARSSCST